MASGNITGTNIDTYHSSVILLCSMRIVVFLDELSHIDIRTGDIINAYLTARTSEKLKNGPEFAHFGHTGHLLFIETGGCNIRMRY